MFEEISRQFLEGLRQTTWFEYVAVVMGIVSVWFSRLENIWVYPTGLVNTIIYVYLSMEGHLFGEASVNLKKDASQHHVVTIKFSAAKEWMQQLLFFACFYVAIFAALTWLKKEFAQGTLPAIDAFASATAYTGMWLMARKKVESWYWWIATNITSIPLYFMKNFVFTSVYYLVLLVMAVAGLMEWRKRAILHRSN
jgi:nicotinamide mononucleotide transporter